MDRTVSAGYDYTFCVSCTNGHQTKTSDDWNIKLLGSSMSCAGTLNAPTPTDVTLAYSEGSDAVTVYPSGSLTIWDDIFSNTNPIDCPITSCELLDRCSGVA